MSAETAPSSKKHPAFVSHGNYGNLCSFSKPQGSQEAHWLLASGQLILLQRPLTLYLLLPQFGWLSESLTAKQTTINCTTKMPDAICLVLRNASLNSHHMELKQSTTTL
eukprot:2405719-Amphidinium_carterae.1